MRLHKVGQGDTFDCWRYLKFLSYNINKNYYLLFIFEGFYVEQSFQEF